MAFPQSFATVSRRPPDIEDYIDILRRYRSWVIGPTFAGLVIAVLIACWWPDTYVSTATMRIMPQSIPANLVPSIVSGQMQQRLEQMRITILSRGSLISLMQLPSLDLYKRERAHMTAEDAAEKMRNDIQIHYVDAGGMSNRGATAFQISFSYPDRVKASSLVRELVTRYEEQDAQLQKSQASTTTSFITEEMKRVKQHVTDKDAEVAQFQTVNAGKLPENFQANMMQVQSYENMIASLDDAIGRDQQQKLSFETNLQNLKAQEAQARLDLERTETTQFAQVKNGQLANVVNKITVGYAELTAVRQKYTDNMPEVQTLKDQIKLLETERDQLQRDEAASQALQPVSTARTVVNPAVSAHISDLQSQQRVTVTEAANVQTDINQKLQRRKELEAQQKDLQARIAASPEIVSKYNSLLQEDRLAKEEYESMSRKQDLSETAKNLEDYHGGEQLEMLEAPNAPENPTYPNRTFIILTGTLGGLMIGFALAGVKEIKNTSLKNLKDVRAYTNMPILSSIPLLENALLVRRKRRLAWLAWSSAVIIGTILMCGAAYYRYANLAGGQG